MCMKLLIMGAQGSGKGTQCEELTKIYNIPAISTGDLFRGIIATGSELGKKVKTIIDAGALVPDETTVEVLKDRLSKSDCQNGFILDGFPRTMEQAKLLEGITQIDKVIYLNIETKTAIERIGGRRTCPNCSHIHNINYPGDPEYCSVCGTRYVVRDDDTEESILKRLQTFKEKTLPIVDYYRSKGLVIEINANINKEYALNQITEGLNNYLKGLGEY